MLGLRALLLGAAGLGVDGNAVLTSLGLSTDDLMKTDSRLPAAESLRAWREAAALSQDPNFGLHLAEQIQVGAYDVLDYAAQTSNDLGEALSRIVRYFRVIDDSVAIELTVEEGAARLVHHSHLPLEQRERHAHEAFFAMFVVRGRQLAKRHWSPLEMQFHHERPGDISEHKRLFACPLEFSRPFGLMRISQEVLTLPVHSADSALGAIIERHAETLLAKVPTDDTLLPRLERVLRDTLSGGDMSLGSVAKRLGMSSRTLQRRLRDDGLRLKDVTDNVRRDMAETYLGGDLPLCEIAFLLGFSRVGAFVRAFKRWTGTTPAKFRDVASASIGAAG